MSLSEPRARTATARADQGHASASAPRGRPWAGIRPCLAWPPAVGTMQRVERLARHLVQPGATSRLPLAAAAQTSGTHSRQPIFKPEVLAAFDTESYYRDGYWVFPSVMTDAARESWLVALKESDDINNELTKQVDWREDVDWESIGHPPPTPEEIEGLMTRGGFNTKYWIPDRWWFDREMSGTVGRRIPFKPGRRPPSMPSLPIRPSERRDGVPSLPPQRPDSPSDARAPPKDPALYRDQIRSLLAARAQAWLFRPGHALPRLHDS